MADNQSKAKFLVECDEPSSIENRKILRANFQSRPAAQDRLKEYQHETSTHWISQRLKDPKNNTTVNANMNAGMLLLAERLVLAVETISQDVKNMSAYVYDLSYSVKDFLNDQRGEVGISVVHCSESGSLPCDPHSNKEEAFTEGEYSPECDQINGSSVPLLDEMDHEEMSVSTDKAERSDVLPSCAGGIMVEELSENEENGMDKTSDSGRNFLIDFFPDIKDEIDIREDFFPLPEETDVPVTAGAPEVEVTKNGTAFIEKEEAIDEEEIPLTQIKDETTSVSSNIILHEDLVQNETRSVNLVCEQDSTIQMTRYPEKHGSIPETQKVISACSLEEHSVHYEPEDTDRVDGKSLRGYMNDSEEPHQESCRAAGASSSSSEHKLKHDGKEKEDEREMGIGAGERCYRAQKKKKKKRKKASAKKSLSEQNGRQKRIRRLFHCDTCGKCFSNKFHFVIHKRIHTGERPFHCALCNKTCTSKSNLVVHMRVHSEERPYKCSSCDKSYKEKCNLKSHMRLHSAEKPFICRECGKAFTQRGSFSYHLRQHSGEKPFICRECGKAFIQSSSLSCHMRLHSGEKPFTCTECGKAFRNNSTLHSHMRTHTGERPFTCEDCGRSFTQLNSLKRHRRTVHGVASSVS